MFGNLFGKRGSSASGERPSFTGRWSTTFGPMELEQDGDHVRGGYHWNGLDCTLEGQIDQGRLAFTYHDKAQGEGWFELKRHGKFEGLWRQQGDETWRPWIGERGFEGVWDSSFGLLRLIQLQDRVIGFYEGLGSSTIDGHLDGGQLTLRYQEPAAAGDGAFTLADDGRTFTGQWKPDGALAWQPWLGRRLAHALNQIWLVVIEAHWQKHLMDIEYSFGGMLKEFFARVPSVQFAHRFFNNEAGLRQWCRDLMYIPGPVVAVLASHGTAEGLAVQGQTIRPQAISESLRYADNVQLVHLSACLTMQDGGMVKELREHLPMPFSGYTTSVDWAASAIAEFTYLDLILSKGLAPADAAEQLVRMLSFAGDHTATGSPYPAAGFRFMSPEPA